VPAQSYREGGGRENAPGNACAQGGRGNRGVVPFFLLKGSRGREKGRANDSYLKGRSVRS